MATLKKALAEAEDKAAKERASREKHEARVVEAQQQLQGAIERFESLECDCKAQESLELKPRAPSRKFRQPRRLRRVSLSPCIASI